MSEASGKEAKTIHRLLDVSPSNRYKKNESSMIDIVLMYNLLKAVPLPMSVIMIGDTDQLPSVGAGNVFHDMIESGTVPVVRLKKIYCQAENSDIIKNAHKINQGEFPLLKTSKQSDFFFIEQEDNSLIPQIITKLCTQRLPNAYPINPRKDVQVLCPMQKGDTGAVNLNTVLQSALNKNTLSVKRGGIEFHLSDKVMQIKNNYDKEVFNGDMGIINKINLEDSEVTIDFDGRKINYDIADKELEETYKIVVPKPTYIPNHGSLYSIEILTANEIFITYENEENDDVFYYSISFIQLENDLYIVEKTKENPELYQKNDINYYMTKNKNWCDITWRNQNQICNISGVPDIKECKKIINGLKY